MNEPPRRAWSKPELIVLVRGKPEEAVLTGCKNDQVGGGPHVDQRDCLISIYCDECTEYYAT